MANYFTCRATKHLLWYVRSYWSRILIGVRDDTNKYIHKSTILYLSWFASGGSYNGTNLIPGGFQLSLPLWKCPPLPGIRTSPIPPLRTNMSEFLVVYTSCLVQMYVIHPHTTITLGPLDTDTVTHLTPEAQLSMP